MTKIVRSMETAMMTVLSRKRMVMVKLAQVNKLSVSVRLATQRMRRSKKLLNSSKGTNLSPSYPIKTS